MSVEYPPNPIAGATMAPMTIVPESLQAPVTIEEVVPTSAVPAAARAKLTDRLRKRKPREIIIDLGDGDQVLVKGLDVYAVEAMNTTSDGMQADADAPQSLTERNPKLMRRMCFDPETGESLFGTGLARQVGVDPETDEPIIEVDGWTDEEINKLDMAVVTALMEGVNYVMGRTTEPGKDSPSTPDSGSSSS